MRSLVLLGLALVCMPATVLGRDEPRDAPGAASRGAQQPAAALRVEVIVIEAGAGDAGVAPALTSIPQLRRPPFDGFAQMSLVSRATIPLTAAGASTPGPQGSAITVALASPSPEGRVTLTITLGGGGSLQVVAGPGEPFFTVRAARSGRATIFGFIVRRP